MDKHMNQVYKSKLQDRETLFAALVLEKVGLLPSFNRLTEDEHLGHRRKLIMKELKIKRHLEGQSTKGSVVIKGNSGLLIRIAKCCNQFQAMRNRWLHHQGRRCCDSESGLYESRLRQLSSSVWLMWNRKITTRPRTSLTSTWAQPATDFWNDILVLSNG